MYIYCITNTINGKRYVGKTTQSIEERFKKHISDSTKDKCEKRPLYDAFNKYGVENFIIEELEQVEDSKLLTEREIYWIQELQTYGNTGYNATKGGDGKVLYDYHEIIDLYNLGYNGQQVADKIKCHVSTVYKVLKAHNIPIRGGSSKLIDQFDKAGNFIQTFYSSLDAADWLVDMGKSKSKHSASNHIIDCCNNKCKSCGGYVWKYKSVPE